MNKANVDNTVEVEAEKALAEVVDEAITVTKGNIVDLAFEDVKKQFEGSTGKVAKANALKIMRELVEYQLYCENHTSPTRLKDAFLLSLKGTNKKGINASDLLKLSSITIQVCQYFEELLEKNNRTQAIKDVYERVKKRANRIADLFNELQLNLLLAIEDEFKNKIAELEKNVDVLQTQNLKLLEDNESLKWEWVAINDQKLGLEDINSRLEFDCEELRTANSKLKEENDNLRANNDADNAKAVLLESIREQVMREIQAESGKKVKNKDK